MLKIEKSGSIISIDLPHAALLLGVITSLKPNAVLEFGYGTGFASRIILQGLSYNGKGELLTVDNWADWGGDVPDHVKPINRLHAIGTFDEGEFVRRAKTGRYDVLVSDADHVNCHKWVADTFRIVRSGGFLFFHDTANSLFPNMAEVVEYVKKNNFWYYHFCESSRFDEMCDRGWLMVMKP